MSPEITKTTSIAPSSQFLSPSREYSNRDMAQFSTASQSRVDADPSVSDYMSKSDVLVGRIRAMKAMQPTFSTKNGPSPPPAKTFDNVSRDASQGSGDKRHGLAAMHARVRDENDYSHISEERPPTVELTARNTRFVSAGNKQYTARDTLPSKSRSAQDFMQAAEQQIAKPHTNTTVQPQASRFGWSSSQAREHSARGLDYAAVGEIPLPVEEDRIFTSLKLLHDKVQVLEHRRTEGERRRAEVERLRAKTEHSLREYQQFNRAREMEKGEKRKLARADSALGMTDGGSDGGDEMGKGSRKWTIEKSRLDSEIQVLKLQVYSNKDLLITSELAAEGVRRDRDLAITELRAAHCTIEYYKREKKTLKAEVKQLKEEKEALKARLTANYVDETDDQECPWLELAKSESEGMDFSLGLGPSISQAGNAQHGEKSSADLTYMTLPNDGEVDELRKTLEQERTRRKQELGTNYPVPSADTILKQAIPSDKSIQQQENIVPRRSLFKDLKRRLSNKANDTQHSLQSKSNDDLPTHNKTCGRHHRRHSLDSVMSRLSRPRGQVMEDKTSETEAIEIPMPVPVSERMPEAVENEDDATIRPSQPPAIALAFLLKDFEKELSQSKLQLASYQSMYDAHDPALGRRKRNVMSEKMNGLRAAIDVQCDRIYRCYDVLEGLKTHA